MHLSFARKNIYLARNKKGHFHFSPKFSLFWIVNLCIDVLKLVCVLPTAFLVHADTILYCQLYCTEKNVFIIRILNLSMKWFRKEGDGGMRFVHMLAVNQYSQRFKILSLSCLYHSLIKIWAPTASWVINGHSYCYWKKHKGILCSMHSYLNK